MSGNIDDMKFSLDVELQESLQGLRDVVTSLDVVKTKVAEVKPAFDILNAAAIRLGETSAFIGDPADMLRIKLGSALNTIERLNSQTERFGAYVEQTAQMTPELMEHWQYINSGVRSSTDSMRQFTEQARAASTAIQTITIDTANNKITPAKPQASWDMVKLASAALALRAVEGVSSAMTKARTAIREIGTSTTTTVSALDRFRMGLAAPAVNPALNTLPSLIQNISGKVAGAVDHFRGFSDATIQGIPSIMQAIAGGLGKVMGAGDNMQATVSKITSQLDLKRQALDRVAKIYPTTGTAVDLLKRAMDVVAPAAEKVAQQVDKANDSVREATIGARNLAYLATGSFAKTGTSADLYAAGAYHALLPTRLMVFESQFATKSLTLMRTVYTKLTTPIHAVAMAVQRSKGEFREMRANLPPLTGGLQLGTRAFRAFSHTTLFAAQTLRTIRTAATPITWLGGQLWNLVRPAKAAKVGIDGIAVGGHKAGVVLRGMTAAASQTASALGRVASASKNAASSSVGNMFSAIPGKAMMATAGVAAFGVAMLGMGTKTAMATEKNQAVFGVMLKDVEQGKAVVASLQNAASVGLFDNDEVLNSGRLLFKAGVAAKDLAGKTDQLATIAAATSTELGDLTRIYQQGANRGSFGQDKINQMAERGIDIYHALEATTGKSGAALADMISGGKIGITEMDAALAHLTEGNGIYAGSLQTLGNTTSGMLSTIKNNIMQALGTLMGAGTEARKPFLQMLVGWSESVKSGIGAVTPIVTQFSAMIKSIFTGVFAVTSAVFGGIFSGASMTFSGILSTVMSWVTKFRFFFENLLPITQFAFTGIGLAAVTMFNDIAYWLTDTLPAYASWFGDNFVNIFRDFGAATGTIFSNLGTNIKNAMTAIWDFITSGGTSGLELTWTPLLDGFKSTVSELPDVPARAMTELESSMNSSWESLGSQLADNYDKMQAEAQAALVVEPPAMPEIDPTLGGGGMKTGEDTAGGGNKRTSFNVGNLERGSQAALDAIFAAQGKDKIGEKSLNVQKQMNGHLAKIANKPDPVVLGAV